MQEALARGRNLTGRYQEENDQRRDTLQESSPQRFEPSRTVSRRVEQEEVSLSPGRDSLIRANASQDMRSLNYFVDFTDQSVERDLKAYIAQKINGHVDRIKSQQSTFREPAARVSDELSFGGRSGHDHVDASRYDQAEQRGWQHEQDREEREALEADWQSSQPQDQYRDVEVEDGRYDGGIGYSQWTGKDQETSLAPHTSNVHQDSQEDVQHYGHGSNAKGYDRKRDYGYTNLHPKRHIVLGDGHDAGASRKSTVRSYTPVLESKRHKSAVKPKASIQIQFVEKLRKTATMERRDVPIVAPGEKEVKQLDESKALARYHVLRNRPVQFPKALVKWSLNRVNPPRCLLDALEGLFSLIYGLYQRIEPHFFNISEKKYFLYKSYLQHVDDLLDVTDHLRMYMETQGLPARNTQKADECLVRYKTTSKRVEAKEYKEQTDQIVEFVRFHIEYYQVLKVK